MATRNAKIYVLDTNVILHNAHALTMFQDNTLIIPIVVVEEVDRFKKDIDEKGRNARQFSRIVDDLSKRGSLAEGVKLDNGGYLKIVMNGPHKKLEKYPFRDTNDNLIISAALEAQEQEEQKPEDERKPVTLVSQDANVRIKAQALKIKAESFEGMEVKFDELYPGYSSHFISAEAMSHFYEKKVIPFASTVGDDENQRELYPHECLLLQNEVNPKNTALARFNKALQEAQKLIHGENVIFGIKGRNAEQKFALELLMDDKIRLVTLVGMAGTGKTLLALAAGMQKVVEEEAYRRLVVARPIYPLGKDLGYLPGAKEEKYKPWMQPIYDNIDFLMTQSHYLSDEFSEDSSNFSALDYLIAQGSIILEPLTYIRGRSITKQFLIIDEAQNLTPHEIKTIITRAGEDTKVVLTGDPYQIDVPYLDPNSNGLSYIVERFAEEELTGHITLSKGERSGLAEMAAKRL